MKEDFAVTTEYMEYLTDAVFSSVKNGQDNSLIVIPGMSIIYHILGLINTRVLPFQPKNLLTGYLGKVLSEKFIYIIINFENPSLESFFEQFTFCLNNNQNLVGQFPIPKTVNELYSIVSRLMQKYTIVVMLFTVPTPNDLPTETYKALRAFQNINTSNFRIIYNFYKVDFNNPDAEYRIFLKNVTYIKPFELKDVEHYTKRLYKRYGYKTPSIETIKNIYQLSGGLTSYVKNLILVSMQAQDKQPYYTDYEYKYFEQIPKILTFEEKLALLNLKNIGEENIDNNSYLKLTGLLKMQPIVTEIQKLLAKDRDLNSTSSNFTKTEWQILQYLFNNCSKIITREEIAEKIWGIEVVEKYSDWTIDKHIANIRKKLGSIGEITTLKTRGFKFLKFPV